MNSKTLTLLTFPVLALTVLIVGLSGRNFLVQKIRDSYISIQTQNNENQAVEMARRLEMQLDEGKNQGQVIANTQNALEQTAYDESGFVCLLDENGEVVGHPNPKAIGQKLGAHAFHPVDHSQPFSMSEQLPEKSGRAGFLSDMDMMSKTHLVYQVPVEHSSLFVSVHSNQDLLEDRVVKMEDGITAALVPISFILVLLGSLSVRTIGRLYESRIERINASLEVRVEERTEELSSTIVELKQARNQLLQNEKMVLAGQLVAGITHELNNPLAVIMGFSEIMLMKRKMFSDEALKWIEGIHRNGVRCRNLVQNMLSFVRNRKPEIKEVEINDLIVSVDMLMGAQMRQSKVNYNVKVEDALPRIFIDPIKIEQVLINLLNNARQALIEAKTKEPEVGLIVSKKNDRIEFSVADNGPGLAPEIRENLFEPFRTTKPEGEGTGLGLSLCKRFVEAHNGTMSVSEHTGPGTTFVFQLPLFNKG